MNECRQLPNEKYISLDDLLKCLHNLYYEIKKENATSDDCKIQIQIIAQVITEKCIPGSYMFGVSMLAEEYFSEAVLNSGVTKEGFSDYLVKNMNSW